MNIVAKFSSKEVFFKVLLCAFSLIYLSIVLHYPVSLFTEASLDDGLYIRLGQNIYSGHWLGQYDNTTLAKGPTFPIFLALNAILGTPITLSIGVFYLFSCYFLTKKIIELRVNKYWGLLIFFTILFHPYVMPVNIIRDVIYPALVLILICALIDLINIKRLKKNQMLAYGLVFGGYWCTREEGVWVIPTLIGFTFIRGALLYKYKEVFYNYLKSLMYFVLGAFFFIFVICTLNFLNYGKFIVIDTNSKSYINALNHLYDTRIENEISFLAVPKEKRDLLYKVSPSFSELREYFDNQGMGWTQHGCSYYPETCNDFSTGWMMWALRSAVASKGYYSTPAKADEFFDRISSEIDLACRAGQIECRSPGLIMLPFSNRLPPITQEQIKNFSSVLKDKFIFSLNMKDINYLYAPSNDLNIFQTKIFLGSPRTSPSIEELNYINTTTIDGWYYKRDKGTSWISSECEDTNGIKYFILMNRNDSPDIAKHFNDNTALRNRFNIKFSLSDSTNCGLIIDHKKIMISDFLDSSFPKEFQINDATLYIQSLQTYRSPLESSHAINVRKYIINLYSYFVPFVFFIGILTFFYNICTFKKNINVNLLVITLVALYLSRILILSIVEATLFPVRTEAYMSIGFLLPIIASLVSIYSTFTYISSKPIFTRVT
jgi:hypothetical protein